MSQTYKERGLPGVQDREVRALDCTPIDGEHTLAEYLSLYRQGEVGPLRYKSRWVPVRPCRGCGLSRPNDGTPCTFCGAYQHCAPDNSDADSRIIEAQRASSMRLGVPKQVNPRRRICNGR